jgi:protein CpxP
LAVAAAALGLAMTLTIIQRAAAQGPPPEQGDGRPGMGDRLAQELGLTADQQTKMRQVMEQNRAQMKALRDDQSLSQEDRMAKMRALRQAEKTQMDAILTPEQKQKMESMRENHPGGPGMGHGEGGMGPGGMNPGEHLAKELNLTQDQQSKVSAIFKQNEQQMRAIHDDKSLSPEDRHAKMQQIHESMKSQMNGVLTSEQQQKFAQLQKEHGPGRGEFGGHGPGGRRRPGGQDGQQAPPPPPPADE